MNETKSTSVYFWVCIAQSLIIIGLAFYTGKEKMEKKTIVKEKDMASFSLMVREAEVAKLKAIVDTCHGKKK
ncbi:MAG: hypothetical protein JWO58_304 [Chitinophagaceae bacterium]|nr:hypothetical protein [Chitinophagaceae bacterium]